MAGKQGCSAIRRVGGKFLAFRVRHRRNQPWQDCWCDRVEVKVEQRAPLASVSVVSEHSLMSPMVSSELWMVLQSLEGKHDNVDPGLRD